MPLLRQDITEIVSVKRIPNLAPGSQPLLFCQGHDTERFSSGSSLSPLPTVDTESYFDNSIGIISGSTGALIEKVYDFLSLIHI